MIQKSVQGFSEKISSNKDQSAMVIRPHPIAL
jgi:hypothetical protein